MTSLYEDTGSIACLFFSSEPVFSNSTDKQMIAHKTSFQLLCNIRIEEKSSPRQALILKGSCLKSKIVLQMEMIMTQFLRKENTKS